MNTAIVRIKGIDGDLSGKKPFNTDILNLRKGDIVLVFKDKGIELAVFEGYSVKKVDTTGFIIDKVSGDRVAKRLREQRKLFALASGEPEEVLKLEDIYYDRGEDGIDEENKNKDKDKYYFDLDEEECEYTGIRGNDDLNEDDDLMDSESLVEKFTKKLKSCEEIEDRYEAYVDYVNERGLEPVDFYEFEEYFY